MANADVRQKIKESNVYHWAVADAIGISESTFTKWMRKELPPEKKQEIFKAIEQLKGGK